MNTFKEITSKFLELVKEGKPFDEFMEEIEEVDVNVFMTYKGGLWISTYSQSPGVLYAGHCLTPKPILLLLDTIYSSSCRLDAFTDGSCFLITKGFDFKPRFFMWDLCKHELTSSNIGRCYTNYTCAKCGYSYNIDSGD